MSGGRGGEGHSRGKQNRSRILHSSQGRGPDPPRHAAQPERIDLLAENAWVPEQPSKPFRMESYRSDVPAALRTRSTRIVGLVYWPFDTNHPTEFRYVRGQTQGAAGK